MVIVYWYTRVSYRGNFTNPFLLHIVVIVTFSTAAWMFTFSIGSLNSAYKSSIGAVPQVM